MISRGEGSQWCVTSSRRKIQNLKSCRVLSWNTDHKVNAYSRAGPVSLSVSLISHSFT